MGNGWYAGPHFGIAWYNIATGGQWRWQDHNGNTPAIGGGIEGGYRLAFGKDSRWGIEFSLGAGIYDVRYDQFHNSVNGLLHSTHHKTYIGLDHIGISFSFSFDLTGKGGRR